jgi:hypothetical protein
MLRKSLLLAPSLLLLLAASSYATDEDAAASSSVKKVRPVKVETDLKATNEVPVVSSMAASGHFSATLDEENLTITYELSYEGLEGSVLAGHVHVGQVGVNGAIPLFLCANGPAIPPAGSPAVQACPPPPATITGVLTPADIIPRIAQGIDAASAQDFVELIRLMRDGHMYANVHSTKYIGGEIRGQVRRDLIPDLKDILKR